RSTMTPPAPGPCGGFSLAHYRELVRTALELGYRFATFSEHEHVVADRLFLMRHDVDLSVDLAANFARIEAELGIRATYFVRVHARYYNPFEFHTYRKLPRVAALGS